MNKLDADGVQGNEKITLSKIKLSYDQEQRQQHPPHKEQLFPPGALTFSLSRYGPRWKNVFSFLMIVQQNNLKCSCSSSESGWLRIKLHRWEVEEIGKLILTQQIAWSNDGVSVDDDFVLLFY